MIWILDPGHGGIDSSGVYRTQGKRSPKWDDGQQIFEGDVNRHIASLLADMLELCLGLEHERDYFFTVEPSDPVDMPLNERVALANDIHSQEGDVRFLSIHCNAGGGTGYEVYTYPGQSASDEMATVFYTEFLKEFDVRGRPGHGQGEIKRDPDKEAEFYVLSRSSCPAVLTENLFMDTREPDFNILNSKRGRARIAWTMYRAIERIEAG